MVQARELMAMDVGESSDPYCKIALGKERVKTRYALRIYVLHVNRMVVVTSKGNITYD